MFLAAALLFAAPPAVAVAPAPRVVGEYVQLESDPGPLKGFIDLPDRPGPWPVVILHAGSGPTDRNGNGPLVQTDCLKMLGRELAAEGVAVLRIDKRGIAGSIFALSREEEIRLDNYAADVLAWAAMLRKDGRFTKLGFVGHSEGALIGLVAAKGAKFDAFVSLCGPGRALQDVLREQLKVGLPEDLYKASDAVIAELVAGRTVKECPKGLEALFRPSVQPYLISSFKYDPAKLVADLACPVLVVGGSTDIQVTAEDAERLGKANPKARVVTVRGMNHILKAIDTTNRSINALSYLDPKLPLHPRLMLEVGGFLKPALAGK